MNRVTLVLAACLLVSVGSAGLAENLIENGDFGEWGGSGPGHWAVAHNEQQVSQETTEKGTALKVEIVEAVGSSYGEIRQKVDVKRHTIYRLTGKIRATKDHTAFFQLKRRARGQELERIKSEWNEGTDWTRITQQIDSGKADEISVLCRYRQRAENVGTTVWFTDVTLEEIGESPHAAEARAETEQAMKLKRVPGLAEQLGERKLRVAEDGRDVYVMPKGAGDRDGSDWDNAMAAADGGLQRAWNAAGPGDTVYVGSGEYKNVSLDIGAGGPDHYRPVTLQGVDTGGGLPRFVSLWHRSDPASGLELIEVEEQVGYVRLADLRVTRYRGAVELAGRNVGVRIDNIDVTHSRDAFVFRGGATPDQPHLGTEDVVMRDCRIVNYTKRGLRIRDGVSCVRVIRCSADAGGEDYYSESFPMGFSVQGSDMPGVFDHDIVFTDCTARNNYQERRGKYWNADGFNAETQVYDITWVGCRSFDNTDGGWDVKARNPVLINCISLRNKRNFRFWSDGPVLLKNCLSGHAIKRGGTGNAIGLNVMPGVHLRAEHCTLVNNRTGIHVFTEADGGTKRSLLELNNCIIAEKGNLARTESGAAVRLTDCVIYPQPEELPGGVKMKGCEFADPELETPEAGWEGGSEAFNSAAFPDRGYRLPQ